MKQRVSSTLLDIIAVFLSLLFHVVFYRVGGLSLSINLTI